MAESQIHTAPGSPLVSATPPDRVTFPERPFIEDGCITPFEKIVIYWLKLCWSLSEKSCELPKHQKSTTDNQGWRIPVIEHEFSETEKEMIERLLTPIISLHPDTVAHSLEVGCMAAYFVEFIKHNPDLIFKTLTLATAEKCRLKKIIETILEAPNFRLMAILHDIGKKDVEETKPGLLSSQKLTDDQINLIERHPLLGSASFVREYSSIFCNPEDIHYNLVLSIHTGIISHHERPDGDGYPLGLGGSREIPIFGLVMAALDTFQTMHRGRNGYREPKSATHVLMEFTDPKYRIWGRQLDILVIRLIELFVKKMVEWDVSPIICKDHMLVDNIDEPYVRFPAQNFPPTKESPPDELGLETASLKTTPLPEGTVGATKAMKTRPRRCYKQKKRVSS
ncbi:MAG: HD-GYP domain-containing protein [Patescibacteria group bacterium]